MSTRDEQIGKNLSTLRGDVSQKDLAQRMKRLGWKWSQATVWTIETGERPLRLAEAVDLAEILEDDIWALLRTDDHFRLIQNVRAAQIAMEDASRAQERFLELVESIADQASEGGAPAEEAAEIMNVLNAHNGISIKESDIEWRTTPPVD